MIAVNRSLHEFELNIGNRNENTAKQIKRIVSEVLENQFQLQPHTQQDP